MPKSAVVLIASKQTLLQLLGARSIVEEPHLTSRRTNIYANNEQLNRLPRVALLALYNLCRTELRDNNIPYVLADNNDDKNIE